MTVRTVKAAQLIADTFDISGFVGAVAETPGSREMKEKTTFASKGFKVSKPSIRAGKWSVAGYSTDDIGNALASLITPADLGESHGFSLAEAADGATVVAGDWCQFGTGRLSKWAPIGTQIGEFHAFTADWDTTDAFAGAGRVAAPLATRTTSGLTGVAIPMAGPGVGQRMWALLQVTAAAGTNLVVKIQSDDNANFTSATDRITFATMSAIGTQMLSVAGDLSTETHWRALVTIASSTFEFAVQIGVA